MVTASPIRIRARGGLAAHARIQRLTLPGHTGSGRLFEHKKKNRDQETHAALYGGGVSMVTDACKDKSRMSAHHHR
jgi:hypothetical protein